MEQIMEEGSARIHAFVEGKVSKRLPVFYNPVMKLNRDISILLLNSLGKRDIQLADPLAGSGIRAIRFLNELDKGIINNISINDLSENAVKNISRNLRLNKIALSKGNIRISNEDANRFLLKSTGFDYIDIDPFGPPTPFLDSAITRLSRDGILAVTATDTAALAGSSKKACLRKYWAVPLRNELMHEIGIRILIRRVQLIGAEHEKALIPIFSYTDEHYYRVFFRCEKGRQKVDEMLENHNFFIYDPKTMESRAAHDIFNNESGCVSAGPLWTGQLWDRRLVEKMAASCPSSNRKLYSLLSILKEEAKKNIIGFYSLPELFRREKIQDAPRIEAVIKQLESSGFFASRTILKGDGLRTDAPIKEIVKALKMKR